MAGKEWLEVPVFIHGITPEAAPQSHAPLFRRFLERLNAALAARDKPALSENAVIVEWGWEVSNGADRVLAAAERVLAARVFDAYPAPSRLPHPVQSICDSIRLYFLRGFADLVYYASPDGQRALRENVFDVIGARVTEIQETSGERAPRVSLTFLTHSAGAVIGHDFLIRLFEPKGHGFFGWGLNKARKLARKQALRARRFFTLGSPLAPFILRDDAVVARFKDNGFLDVEPLGLRPGDGLAGPRWLNIWDRDDIFSYPVARLYGDGGPTATVVDRLVNLGGTFPGVHRKYWESEEVINALADAF
jgi:hypothetical protein